MRPRSVSGVPGSFEHGLTPYARFEKFARMIARVPKAEINKRATKTAKAKLTERTIRAGDCDGEGS
jgi:hypothetical protein